mmetsp:Transcript_1486/g.988  ORF Transcript_1486/g.988 Transcript_1486/m.988 type:complete len:184 (+) Transcript_1486:1077-1628(+)
MKDSVIKKNVAIMSIIWLTSSFCYYLIMFEMKYFPGNIFVNSYVSIVAQIPGNILGAMSYQRFGFRFTIMCSMAVSGIGALLILLLKDTESFFYVLVLLAKIGVVSSFNVIYIAHSDLFPVLFAATAMGICNTIARLGTIGAPSLAEVSGPLPMIICAVLCAISLIAVSFITTGVKDIYAKKG